MHLGESPSSYSPDDAEPPAEHPERDGPEAKRAFHQQFDTHFEPLCRYVYRYLRSIEDARDVVHDVFLQLWRQRQLFDMTADLRGHLYVRARHRALDLIRHRSVESRWRDRSMAVGVEEAESADATQEAERLLGDLIVRVQHAIETLPQRQREVLTLRWQQQMSYKDIGDALGISHKTVGVHLTRAIAQLRELLPPDFDRT
jgi:RNA polymerase sigma-70 factor (ECF subfamily)